MEDKEPNYEKVGKNFPDHIFSNATNNNWPVIDCNNIISKNMSSISEIVTRIKETSLSTANNYNSVKKFLAKVQLTKRTQGAFGFKAFGFNNIQGLSTKRSLKDGIKKSIDKRKTFRDETIKLSINSGIIGYLGKTEAMGTSHLLTGLNNGSEAKHMIIPQLNLNRSTCANGKKPTICNTTRASPIKPIIGAKNQYSPRTERVDDQWGSPQKTYREIRMEYKDQLRKINDSLPHDITGSPVIQTPYLVSPYQSAETKVKTTRKINETDRSMFEKRLKKSNSILFREERAQLGFHIKNPDYSVDEMKQLKKELKAKGCFITDIHNKKKYYTIDKENVFKKDYFINTLTENAASRFKKLLHDRYLVNERNYSYENNEKLVSSNCLKKLDKRQDMIVKLNKNVKGKLNKILKKNKDISTL
jgi:hypothetical protein